MLLVVVLIVTGVIITKKQPSTVSSVATNATAIVPATTPSLNDTAAPSTDATAAPTTAPNQSISAFKDGAYTANGKYSTPESTESITVNVTLKNGVIIDTSANATPRSRDSREYVTMFLENYKSQVIGKNISELKLGRVSGSSLTPQGFNTALESITSQAKA